MNFKKVKPFLFSFLILFLLLVVVLLSNPPSAPIFSVPSGFFEVSFLLTIDTAENNVTVHYTLDGSIPTRDSPVYSAPIVIKDRSDEPNTISMISTISYRYAEPKENIFKITTVRARSFNRITKAPGPVVTHSYLVHPEIFDRYSLPIISLVVDPKDFFDQETGVYVTGKGPEVVAADGERYYFWPANYHERGEDWERPIYFEYFDLNGDLLFSQKAGVRIHGVASRSYRQKSFRLYADRKYDDFGKFNFSFFPKLYDFSGKDKIDSFETIILRNSGTDFGSSFMRDVLIQKLVEHTSMDTQANKPVIVFLNGEYWGIYYIYERYDEDYFQNHYDIDPKNVVVLEEDGDSVIGVVEDQGLYQDLLEFVQTKDVREESVYSEIQSLIDIENFIDYQITEIFIAHRDWPKNNIKFWRVRTASDDLNSEYGKDGRWRWLLFDTDHGFIDSDNNTIQYATREDLPNDLFRNLILNPEFKEQFLNRFADHLNSSFRTERVLEEIDRIEAVLEPEMQEQINRWHSSGNSMEDWHNNVNLLRSFAGKRPGIMFEDLVGYFGLDGTYKLTVSSDIEKGFVQVNSIEILPSTPGIETPEYFEGTYFQGVPVLVSANPQQGYQFSHWEGSELDGETNPVIEILSDEDIHIQPFFIPID
jgi:hypothetical protein